MAIWIKQNGIELELNNLPETIKQAKLNKWQLKDKPKAGRPKKDKS